MARPEKEKVETELGVLDVTLISAKGLQKMDLLGLSDPYCILKLLNETGKEGKTQFKTKYMRQTLAPTWNFECCFGIETSSKKLRIKMFDHDDFGVDDSMGTVDILLEPALTNDVIDWFPLLSSKGEEIIGEDGTNAMVRVALKFTSHALTSNEKTIARQIYGDFSGEKDLVKAIKKAAGSIPRKRVLLQLGTNWSSSCKRMYFCLSQEVKCRSIVEKNYIYILLDAENELNFDILKKLGEPQWLGFPILVILDGHGKFIHTQPTGELETDPILTSEQPDEQKIISFLEFWKEDGENDRSKRN